MQKLLQNYLTTFPTIKLAFFIEDGCWVIENSDIDSETFNGRSKAPVGTSLEAHLETFCQEAYEHDRDSALDEMKELSAELAAMHSDNEMAIHEGLNKMKELVKIADRCNTMAA